MIDFCARVATLAGRWMRQDHEVANPKMFQIERIEPRLLLSADLLPAATIDGASDLQPAAPAVVYLEQPTLISVNFDEYEDGADLAEPITTSVAQSPPTDAEIKTLL